MPPPENSPSIDSSGLIYTRFTADGGKYGPDLKASIEQTVVRLLSTATSSHRPGMLLGKIQSGKTRTFMGIMALAFDNGFDICVVLTKGTKALAKQTYERISSEFTEFVPTRMQVYDIMNLPSLSGFEQKLKLVFVVKKQADNLDRLSDVLFRLYPALS